MIYLEGEKRRTHAENCAFLRAVLKQAQIIPEGPESQWGEMRGPKNGCASSKVATAGGAIGGRAGTGGHFQF